MPTTTRASAGALAIAVAAPVSSNAPNAIFANFFISILLVSTTLRR
jgi:hypothetical protein